MLFIASTRCRAQVDTSSNYYKEDLMTTPTKLTQARIKSLGFIPTEVKLSYANDEISYITDARGDVGDLKYPGVYLIVQEFSDDTVLVQYVGKAGQGLNQRFRQHEGGYKRNQKRKNTSAGMKKMIKAFEMEPRTMHVWFRKSNIKQLSCALATSDDSQHLTSTYLSMYSTEEEALILYFLNEEQDLINISRPRPRNMLLTELEESNSSSTTSNNDLTLLEKAANDQEAFPELEALTMKLKETPEPDLHKVWLDALEGWDTMTKECFSATLQNLELEQNDLFKGRTPKIIGKYSTGPFRNEPILVFGELVNTNFRPGTNNLIFTLDGKYMVQYPFNLDEIKVIALEEYCAQQF